MFRGTDGMAKAARILIVKEDTYVREMLKGLLVRDGFDVQVAGSGRLALDLLDAHHFELVLLDVFLSDADGFQIMDTIHRAHADTYVIIITKFASPKVAVEALRRGAHDYLNNPYEHEKLLRIVHNAVNTIRMEKERAMARHALQRSEERYRALFEASPIETVIVDREGRVTGYNQAKKLSGDRLPAIGDVMYRDYASDHEIDMHRELIQCIRTGTPREFKEMRYRERYLYLRISPYTEGAIISSIDVTERKKAEAALRDSEEKLRAITRTANDGIVMLDCNGKIQLWNPSAERLFQYSETEMIGKNLHNILVPDEFRKLYEKGFDGFRDTGKGKAVGRIFDSWARRKDGSRFPIEVSTAALKLKGKWHAAGIIRDVSERKKIEEELKRLSYSDGLTGIANRRYFEEFYSREWRRALRDRRPLALIMCDIDFFKAYNDTNGHLFGDDCLKQVAAALNSVLKRPADMVARYGGEEFVAVLPNTSGSNALAIAETQRRRIEKLGIAHTSSAVSDHLTVSMGVAAILPEARYSPSFLLAACDQALYQAKRNGRNRVMVAELKDKPK